MKNQDRNSEIVSFFYKILGRRVHMGVDPEEARKAAYDAVSLRYGICKGRLLNIISENRNSQKVNENVMQQNILTLIGELHLVNEGYDEAKAKNEQLISYLKECLDEY